MNTISEINSNGQGMTLGPVTVKKNWGVTNGQRSSFLELDVTDNTGEMKLKLWGPMSSLQVNDGDVLSFRSDGKKKSGIMRAEYNSRVSFNINGCIVDLNGSSAGGGSQGRPAPAGPARSTTDGMSFERMVKAGLHFVKMARELGESDGAVLASIYGSCMFAIKEGRPLLEKKPATSTPEPEPQQESYEEEDDDDIPL